MKINERKEQRKEKETLLPAPLYKEKEKIIEKKERGKIIFISTHAQEKENFEEFSTVESDDVVNEKGAAAKKQEAAGSRARENAEQTTTKHWHIVQVFTVNICNRDRNVVSLRHNRPTNRKRIHNQKV